MIKPTRGRVVLYTPDRTDQMPSGGEPLAAMVVHVHSDDVVGLIVFDAFGRTQPRPSVRLVQDGTEKPKEGPFAEWMPYQKGQAAKTEQVEAQLAACAPNGVAAQVAVVQAGPSENEIECEIAAKGKTAPRVTPQHIEDAIGSEFYFTAEDGVVGKHHRAAGTDAVTHSVEPHALSLLTFCVLVLRNGFTVTGESACASPENFDAEIGHKIARQNAVQKIWPLLGFALKDRLHAESQYGRESA